MMLFACARCSDVVNDFAALVAHVGEAHPVRGTLRAYVVSAESIDAKLITFSPSRSAAKSDALKSEWFEDVSWTDLRVRRELSIDDYARVFGRGVLEFDTREQCILAWNMRWFEIEFSGEPCWSCQRYEWRLVPESKQDEGGVCADCRSKLTEIA